MSGPDAELAGQGVPIESAIRTLVRASLEVRPSDSVAFVYDPVFEPLREPLEGECRNVGAPFRAIPTGFAGIDPVLPIPEEIRVALTDHNVIVFGLVHHIWHCPERRAAKYDHGRRLAALVSPPSDLLRGSAVADLAGQRLFSSALFRAFEPNSEIRVTTPAGTDFTCRIGVPFEETGAYSTVNGNLGSGGDFPAGEVGFGPLEGTLDGTLAYDVKVQHVGRCTDPLTVTVQADKVQKIEGPNARAFRDYIAAHDPVLNYVSEVSVGTNPSVSPTDDERFIPEEKMVGTLHCGHGGNHSYGRRVGPHLDAVMSRPTLTVRGITVLVEGRPTPEFTREFGRPSTEEGAN